MKKKDKSFKENNNLRSNKEETSTFFLFTAIY